MQIERRLLPWALVLGGLLLLARPPLTWAQTDQPAPTPTLAAPAADTPPDSAEAPIPRVHTVQDGENLTIIAQTYDVPVEDILAINNLANGDLLQVGQQLIIPGGSGDAIATVYRLRPGDTLRGVALDFNTTLAEVLDANRVVSAAPPLVVGQPVSVVSRTGSAAPRPSTGRPHLVRPGETLLTIAARYGTRPEALAALNDLPFPTYVYPGQRLRVPDETAVYRDLPEGWLDVRLNPEELAQGSTLSVFVANLLDGRPAGRFGDQRLQFAPVEGGYAALVGIDAFTEPGLYELQVSGGDERGLWQPIDMRLPVGPSEFDTQYITVGEELSALLEPEVRATEDEFLSGIFDVFTEPQQWSGVFQTPVTSTIPVTAAYGGARSYNGGPFEIYHTGVDFASSVGDPIVAPADGVVVFSGDLELRGLTVIIDHGLGVMSGFYHLSETDLAVGDRVAAGEPVGLSGDTGLSTGPHLHWDVRVMDVPVDPLIWTRQAFP